MNKMYITLLFIISLISSYSTRVKSNNQEPKTNLLFLFFFFLQLNPNYYINIFGFFFSLMMKEEHIIF